MVSIDLVNKYNAQLDLLFSCKIDRLIDPAKNPAMNEIDLLSWSKCLQVHITPHFHIIIYLFILKYIFLEIVQTL